jgi:hypothetical protein
VHSPAGNGSYFPGNSASVDPSAHPPNV